ncbi:MAG TPA: DinB family protein [Tepidisphaeraceae bacterium]|nr:DinB family protein [Tepidisphaeraceae bacterium]
MDIPTQLAGLDFGRSRLLGILDTIEKSGQDVRKVLAWRPGPGRAHIGWQAMHCAASMDRALNTGFKGGKSQDEAIVAAFGGGSVPSDQNVPELSEIRSKLESCYAAFRAYVAGLTPDELTRKLASGRTLAESIILYTWHEAHHQGQIHLTWNLYKGSHGIS